MSNMSKVDNTWVLSYDVTGTGSDVISLPTENKFVDADIEITVNASAGSLTALAGTASATDNKSILTEVVSAPSSGAYVTVTGKGKVKVGTGGFIAADTEQESNTATKYYSIQNAQQTVSGGTLSVSSSSTTLASDGLSNGSAIDATKKIALTDVNASGYYELEAQGAFTVGRASVTQQTTTAGFVDTDQSAVEKISAGSITDSNTAKKYYVKQSTVSSSTVVPDTSAQTVTISDGYYHESRTITIEGMTSVTPTTSLSNTGLSTYFNTATQSSHNVEIIPQMSNSAGFVGSHTNSNLGGTEYYNIKTTSVTKTNTTVSGSSATRGTASWGTGWISSGSISAAAFKNSATSGKTYVDISATTDAPVLVSGDYLYIDAGYTDYLKISLARLVPDGSDVHGHAEYILSGHSAYDNDGVLVAGSIQTYDGSYTIS